MPQRILLYDLGTAVGDWTLTFKVGWMKDGRHAYDFITGSDGSTPDADGNPIGTSGWSQAQADCLKIAGFPRTMDPYEDSQPVTQTLWTSGTNRTVNIPDLPAGGQDFKSGYYDPNIPSPYPGYGADSTYARIRAYEERYGDRFLNIYHNGTMSDVQLSYVYPSPESENSVTDVTYTLTWHGSANDFLVAFGGHIAVGVDRPRIAGWGKGFGSANIQGSPHHVKFGGLLYTGDWDGDGTVEPTEIDYSVVGGGRDNAFTCGSVGVAGDKTGTKYLEGDTPADGKQSDEPGIDGWWIRAYKDIAGGGTTGLEPDGQLTDADRVDGDFVRRLSGRSDTDRRRHQHAERD